jgi:hypothetical protein
MKNKKWLWSEPEPPDRRKQDDIGQGRWYDAPRRKFLIWRLRRLSGSSF